jgi:hypothetical protein
MHPARAPLLAFAGFADRLEFGRVKTLLRSLYFQVILAIALGVLLGALYPEIGAAMQPFGDARNRYFRG